MNRRELELFEALRKLAVHEQGMTLVRDADTLRFRRWGSCQLCGARWWADEGEAHEAGCLAAPPKRAR